ncbi:MAG: D-alanine--D-alanine ligase [Leptospiraceae bacterium]|nr:D-alanine--D-alanine ligase [Leptospiraceae bacterium]
MSPKCKNKTVLLVADVYESFPKLVKFQKQEWESKSSILFLHDTIQNLGYSVKIIEPQLSKHDFLLELQKVISQPYNQSNTVLFNLVEGFNSRNREGYIPAIAEFLGISHTGSDAYAQNISLDKYLTKQIAKQINIPTAHSLLLDSNTILQGPKLRFPLFIKPNGEGSSLGIKHDNIVGNTASLKKKAKELLKKYDDLLLEEYLPGTDLTVGIIGNSGRFRATKVASVYCPNNVIYGEFIKGKGDMPEVLKFDISPKIEKEIQEYSICLCEKIGVSGYARVDWKCDSFGKPYFLELNLTPGLSYYYSSFPICYQHPYGTYSQMIDEILDLARKEFKTHPRFSYGKIKKNS